MTIHNSIRVSALSTVGLLFGAALLPAGSAFASATCGDDATLVSNGICEVAFTETPDSLWSPPAGITKLQALLVGGGGAAVSSNDYGGGGGDVVLVELATTGSVDIVVGTGGVNVGNVPASASTIEQGSTTEIALGGENSGADGQSGGDSGNNFAGGQFGSGAGAGGDAGDRVAGEGVIVSEIDADFDLFADDDRCFGGGGSDLSVNQGANGPGPNIVGVEGQIVVQVWDVVPSCSGENGGAYVYPDGGTPDGDWVYFVGDSDDISLAPLVANTGSGGSASRGQLTDHQDGSDGLVAIRYDLTLAETGYDTTGSLVAGAALVAAGTLVATRRRRS
jgi:LPXTG-motif cell wall-anchored protein